MQPVRKPTYEDLVAQGRFAEARSLLTISPEDPAGERRRKSNLLARLLIHEGQPEAALARLRAAEGELGRHVGLSADILRCLYLTGRMREFQLGVHVLESLFVELRPRLRAETIAVICTDLAMFQEEIGEVASAAASLRALLATPLSEDQRYRALANWLRIESLRGGSDPVIAAAHRLLAAEAIPVTGAFRHAEVEHALILAELSLAGAETGLGRLEAFLARETVPLHIRRLALFDAIDWLLAQARSIRDFGLARRRLARLAAAMPDPDAFEAALLDLLRRGRRSAVFARFAELQRELSLSCFLRLLSVAANALPAGARRDEAHRLFTLSLSGLSEASRRFWEARLAVEVVSPALPVILAIQGNSRLVTYADRCVDFSGKASLWTLLEHLLPTGQASLEALSQQLWDQPLNELHHGRIKTLVRRLNQALGPLSGIRNSVRIGRGLVFLDRGVRLTKA